MVGRVDGVARHGSAIAARLRSADRPSRSDGIDNSRAPHARLVESSPDIDRPFEGPRAPGSSSPSALSVRACGLQDLRRRAPTRRAGRKELHCAHDTWAHERSSPSPSRVPSSSPSPPPPRPPPRSRPSRSSSTRPTPVADPATDLTPVARSGRHGPTRDRPDPVLADPVVTDPAPTPAPASPRSCGPVVKPRPRGTEAQQIIRIAATQLGHPWRYGAAARGPSTAPAWSSTPSSMPATRARSPAATCAPPGRCTAGTRPAASRAAPTPGRRPVIWGGGSHVGIYVGHGKAIGTLTRGVRVHGVHAVTARFTAYLHTGMWKKPAPLTRHPERATVTVGTLGSIAHGSRRLRGLAGPLRGCVAPPRPGRHRRPVQPDVRYAFDPFEEAVVGRPAVVAAWLADPDEPGSWEADYEVLAIDGDVCVAHGRTRYLTDDRTGVDREFANIFVCRFDDEGRCREFTE